MMRRREVVLAGLATGGVAALSACAAAPVAAPTRRPTAKVVVVGGGYGGCTATKYLRLFSGQSLDVTLIEPDEQFVSCPVSNRVIGGSLAMRDITVSYAALRDRHGVTLVRDRVEAIDPQGKTVRLAGGSSLAYDKLVLSPGVELMLDAVDGLAAARAEGRIVQAWKAGEETLMLRKQLEAMRDGGVFAIAIPESPYRCPPGPYERACLVAAYLKRRKPKSKVLVLDANEDITSKGPLFRKAWAELYSGMIEYRPQHPAVAVDAKAGIVKFDVQDDVRADVLNILPPMRAGAIAVRSGLATINARWCPVHFRNFESVAAKDIHVVGDSIQAASLMPKSGHLANGQAKVAAAAIVAELAGLEIDAHPLLANTCYSYLSEEGAVHVASVHEYIAAQRTFVPVVGAGGVSAARSSLEARYATAWANAIWADMLG